MKKGRKRFWKRFRRAVREPVVMAAYACASLIVPRLPRAWLLQLAGGLGTLTRYCDRAGRRVARANLAVLCGRRLTPRRSRLLVAGAYRLAALVALDSVWFARDTRARVGRWTTVDPVLDAAVRPARPALLISGHYGNWEMTLLAGGYAGLPLVAVVKQQWSPLLTERLNRVRCALGVRVVFVEGALRSLLRELRAGNVAGFLVDQQTLPKEGGVWVDFGGLPAAVTNGVAVLSRHTAAPVFLAFCRACRDGHYRVTGSAAMRAAPDETDAAFTQRIVNGLLRTFRRHPSQWMLMYKYWDNVAPGDDFERYPFYAGPRRRVPCTN